MSGTQIDPGASAMADQLGPAARKVLAGRATSVTEGLVGRDELRRQGLLRGSPGKERLTEFAKRVQAVIRHD